jgi:Heat-labile enterotoxin alpha chain
MRNYARLVLLNLFAWVLAIAAVPLPLVPPPATVYRGDTRGPDNIKDKGFTTRAFDKGQPERGTLFDHVEKSTNFYDGYISTTTSVEYARKRVGTGYVYYINSSGGNYVDVAAEYAKEKRPYGHADELEFSSHGNIPWAKIIKWETVKDGKVIRTTTREEYEKRSQKPQAEGSGSGKKPDEGKKPDQGQQAQGQNKPSQIPKPVAPAKPQPVQQGQQAQGQNKPSQIPKPVAPAKPQPAQQGQQAQGQNKPSQIPRPIPPAKPASPPATTKKGTRRVKRVYRA